MMNERAGRLSRGLLIAFQVLRAVAVAGLVVLIPACLFAWASPGSIFAHGGAKVNGQPITDVHRQGAALMLFGGIFFAAVGAWVLTQLIAILRTVRAGEPFVPANVAALRRIAGAMAALVVFQLVFGWLASAAERAAYDVPASRFDGGLFLGMLVVLVLAEVFREGVRLREDVEGTI